MWPIVELLNHYISSSDSFINTPSCGSISLLPRKLLSWRLGVIQERLLSVWHAEVMRWHSASI